MLPIVIFQGNLVTVKKDVLDTNSKIVIPKNTIGKITKISINTNTNSGIQLEFENKIIINKPNVTSYISWLRKHFKLHL
jgi:hypothetical protein